MRFMGVAGDAMTGALHALGSGITAAVVLATAAMAQPSAGASVGMAVTVTKASRACFTDTLQVSGVLVPRDEVFVRPDTEGLQVAQIAVEDGDRVTAGQTLARLARPDAQGAAGATVRAPAAGIVNYRSIRVGMTASARADPLFRVIVNGEVELQADVPATRGKW